MTLAFLLLAGCGGEEPDSDSDSDASPKKSTTTATVDPFAPNLGDRALQVGETRKGKQVETTLKAVKYPYPPGQYRRPEKGNSFLGLRIEQCLHAGVTDQGDSTYNGEWAAVTESGEEYGGDGLSWNDWPSPKFPEATGLIPGRCLKGWIALQVPKGTKFQTVIWRSDGTPTAEWTVAP